MRFGKIFRIVRYAKVKITKGTYAMRIGQEWPRPRLPLLDFCLLAPFESILDGSSRW